MADAERITVHPKEVVVADRLREVDEDIVEAICAVGPRFDLHPIIVRRVYRDRELRPRLHLVAGAHRLEAALRLGLSEIPAIRQDMDDSQARIVEIEENTIRKGLRGLERARFLAEWKRLYEEKNPAARHGAHGGRGGKKNENGIFPFSRIAAEKLECDRSTVEKAVAMYGRLTDKVRARISGTWLAEKDSELRALSNVDGELQHAVVDRLLDAENPAGSVAQALAEVEGRVAAPKDRFDRAMVSAQLLWNRGGRKRQDELLAYLVEQEGAGLIDRINALLGGPA